MMSPANVLFWLNILALSPVCSNFNAYSIILRVVQLITIVVSFTSFGVDGQNKRTYNGISLFLLIIFLLNAFSEFAHTSLDIAAIVRLLLHCVYIIALLRLLPNISSKTFCYGFSFLLFAFSLEFILYVKDVSMNPGALLSGDMENIHLLKRNKKTLIENGYSLSSIHVIPFLALVLFPYLERKCLKIISITVAFACVFYSLTLTSLLAFTITVLLGIWFHHSGKTYGSKYVVCMLALYSVFIVILNSYYLFDLYSLTTGRSLLWGHAINSIKEHFLFGISMSDFYTKIYGFYQESDFASVMAYNSATFDFTSGGCHNMYLNWAMNHGIPSFVIYLLFALFLYDGIKKRTGSMLPLLPFIYILIRGTNEASGFIDPSNGFMELIVDIFLIYTIVQHDEEDCIYC